MAAALNHGTTDLAHHGLPAHEVVLLLEADATRGLSPDVVSEPAGIYGPNRLPGIHHESVLRSAARQFNNPLIYVLLAILWINMTTAVALGLMLAFEPKEPGLMARAPRNPDRPLLTWALVFRTLLVSVLLVSGTWWIFEFELARGASVDQARTAAVNLFVVVQLFYLFSCRSLTQSVWRLRPFSNRWLVVGVLIQLAGQAALTYVPVMNHLFHTAPLTPEAWIGILGVGLVASVAVAADKHFRRSII